MMAWEASEEIRLQCSTHFPNQVEKRCSTARSLAREQSSGLPFTHKLKSTKMIHILISLFLAFSCPNHSGNNPSDDGGTVTTQDTGGETGNVPPRPGGKGG